MPRPRWVAPVTLKIVFCCLSAAAPAAVKADQAPQSPPAAPAGKAPATAKLKAPSPIVPAKPKAPAKPQAVPAHSPPVINKLAPLSGAPGSSLTITGTGFGTAKGAVKFNETTADVITTWSDTTITVNVPTGMAPGSATVTVMPSTGASLSTIFTVTTPVTWYGIVSGDFSPFADGKGGYVEVQASVLTQDLQTIGQVTKSIVTQDKMQIFYTQADPKAVPAFVLVGTKSPGDHMYPFTPPKPLGSDTGIVPFRRLIMGHFCLPDKPVPGGQCTTGLLHLVDATGLPVDPPVPPPNQIKAYVQAADGTFETATLNSIGPEIADISFTALSLFKPAWLVLETGNGAHTFAYTPAPPMQIQDLVYTSDDLESVCKPDPNNKNKPNCDITVADDLDPLKPIASSTSATFVAAQDKLLVARVRAPMGLEPTAILVSKKCLSTDEKCRKTSVIVRRTLKPGQNTNLLEVDLTPEDQTTMQRNYGSRIAKRYLGYTLNVKNPTSKKLQFKKSTIYFDVDYVEAEGTWWPEFREAVKSASTLGMIAPNPYKAASFQEYKRPKESHPRVFRFGLEQNVKHSPLNYLSVLGSYDETTEKTQSDFDTVQLLASIMNTIATGGIAGTDQFKVASSLLSGVFLPGLKGIVLNDSRINRHRANLVAQTLQEVIEVPPNTPVSTIVLLPRTGILAFTDKQIPVMIQRVIDVHLATEVVTEVTATPVAKGVCRIGYTKDQTREALGEPTGLTTNTDGSSIFTYPKGPVSSASFDAGGSLVSCQPRSVTDQLAQVTTLVEMNTTLSNLDLTVGKRIGLADESIVLADIPGVQQTFHFDAEGNKAADYTFLFAQIKAFETQKKDDLETFLKQPTTASSPARIGLIKTFIDGADGKAKVAVPPDHILRYPSPDIANGYVVVTFKDDNTTIASVTFQGDKPAGVN